MFSFHQWSSCRRVALSHVNATRQAITREIQVKPELVLSEQSTITAQDALFFKKAREPIPEILNAFLVSHRRQEVFVVRDTVAWLPGIIDDFDESMEANDQMGDAKGFGGIDEDGTADGVARKVRSEGLVEADLMVDGIALLGREGVGEFGDDGPRRWRALKVDRLRIRRGPRHSPSARTQSCRRPLTTRLTSLEGAIEARNMCRELVLMGVGGL